jgi:RNA polymerase-binding protein DksA
MQALYEWASKTLQDRRAWLSRLRTGALAASHELHAQRLEDRDWLDRAADQEGERVAEGLSEQERREIQEIDAALQRLKAGSYGDCTVCGRAIGRQRLRAVPEARLCSSCAAFSAMGKVANAP